MKIWKRIRTNQLGMLSLHALVPIVLAVAAVGGVGAYVLNQSNANTASVCGALYNSNKVVSKTDANWVASKSDPSVRNMAYSMCKLKMMDVTAANAVNASGTWTPALKASIVKFQLSKAQLKGDPDGYPGPLTACLMGLTPTGFSNNSCASVTKPNITAVADPAVPKPTVSFTTSAATVKTGSTATLTWKSTGINVTCTSTIPTVPTPAAAGGSYVYKMPDATAHTFTLTCKNPGGSTAASVKVTGIATTTTTPPPATTTPGAITYKGTFECTVGASITEAEVAWYPVTVTNKTDKATSTLTEINMRGVRADGTWTSFNGTTPATSAANFKWVSGFSGTKMLVNTPAKFNIKTNNMLQDKWVLSISGVQYDCAKAATSSVSGTVDTKQYTTLPTAPSTESMTYTSWRAWSDGVAANKSLTGQALVDKLKPLKEAYEAKVAFAATISCKAVFPATLVLGTLASPKPNTVTLEVTNKGKFTVPANTFTSNLVQKLSTENNGKTTSVVNVPSIAVGKTVPNASSVAHTQSNGTKVTVSFKLLNADKKVVANCDNSYKTYDLNSGAQTATPNSDKPVAVVVAGKTPVVQDSPPANTTSPAVQKVADLGYSAKLYCVTKAKNGNITVAKCSEANALLLAVKGANKNPAKNKLSYGVDVTKTKTDKFGTVNGCAPRTLITTGKDLTYDCTILYTNQSFFAGMRAAIVNRFNSIVNKAKAQTFLNKSEAKAAIDKLKKEDLAKLDTRITLSYPKYTSQVIDGPNLVLDYDEANAVQRIKNIQEADCKAQGGTFISTSDGCELPSSSASSNSGGSSSSTFTKSKCDSLGRVWSNGTCLKKCSSSADKLVTDEPYDVCIKKSSSATTKPTCGPGTYLKSLGGEWACLSNAPSYTLTCPSGYTLVTPNVVLDVGATFNKVDGKVCKKQNGFIATYAKPIKS